MITNPTLVSGWDAYCTGLVFATELQMARLSVDQMRLKAGNKMFMMQSMYTMDLDPAQPSSILKVRGVVFYLYNFPASTSVPDILAAFIALGHRREDLELTWVDGTSTFVTIAGPLPTPEADIVRVYSAQLCSPWKIETLAQFRARSTSTTVSQAADVTTTSSSVWSWMSSFVSSFTSARGSSDNSSDTAQVSKKRKI